MGSFYDFAGFLKNRATISQWIKDYLLNPTDGPIGQAFCNAFNVEDSDLFNETNERKACDMIFDTYC